LTVNDSGYGTGRTEHPLRRIVGARAQRDDILEVIVRPYRVIYRRRSVSVEIVALRYGAREFSGRELA